MNDRTATGEPRPADPHPKLRLAALVAVSIGVVLLAAAAFVFSYRGIHDIALAAGVSARLARVYPLIFDAMLAVAFAAALALRGAGWWTRCYVWLCTLLLLAAVAAGDAVQAMGVALPRKPSAAAIAIIPWTLLLIAFGFLLAMLRQVRRSRLAAAAADTGSPAGEGEGRGNGGSSGPALPGGGSGHPAEQGLTALLSPRPAASAPSLGGALPATARAGLPAPAAPAAPASPAAAASLPGPSGPEAGSGGTRAEDTRAEDTRAADTRAADTRAAGSQAGDTQARDTQARDTQARDTQAGDEGFDDLTAAVEDGPENPAADEDEEPAAGERELTGGGQPLSAPPAPFDRLRSTPTPPEE